MDPLLQYGPNDGGYATALQIALVVIGILVGSWLFGAAYALLSNNAKRNRDSEK